MKHEGDSVIVWAAIYSRALSPFVVRREKVSGEQYRSFSQIIYTLCFKLCVLKNIIYSKMTKFLYTRFASVQKWLDEHNDEMEHVKECPQFPDLNIIEPLWDF
jgi:hypothetical protein